METSQPAKLTTQLKYGSKINAVAASNYRLNVQPQNTTQFTLNDTIIFNLPTRPGIALDTVNSFVRLTLAPLQNGATEQYARMGPAGISAIFKRIRVFHGSNLLEDIDNYNNFAAMMLTLNSNAQSNSGKFNLTYGLSNSTTAIPSGNVNYLPSFKLLPGDFLYDSANSHSTGFPTDYTVNANGTTERRTFCINLFSILGCMNNAQYLPLFAATSSPIRLEIELISNLNQAFCFASNSPLTLAANQPLITNVEYVASVVEISDYGLSLVAQSLEGGDLQFVTTGVRNYQNNYQVTTNTVQQLSFPIPARFGSLKSILVTSREKNVGANGYYASSSTTCGLQSYFWRVGAKTMPSKEVNTHGECWNECIKAVGAQCDVLYSPAIDTYGYCLATNGREYQAGAPGGVANLNQGPCGGFVVGIDLESYPNSSKESTFQGHRSVVDDIFYVPTFNTNAVAVTNGLLPGVQPAIPTQVIRFDAYAFFDQIITFSDGVAFVSY